MILFLQSRGSRRRAFTIVEIAICIGVIAFAIVAVMAALPKGLNTQRDNRENTVIAQDGMYWMDAIRSGAKGLDELTNFVDQIRIGPDTYVFGKDFASGYEIIGLLSRPAADVTAIVRAITSPAADQAQLARDLAFRYEMRVDIASASPSLPPALSPLPQPDVSEVRLVFRWPVTGYPPSYKVGKRERVFRAQESGHPEPQLTNGPLVYCFFIP
jgi:hypothetical protein